MNSVPSSGSSNPANTGTLNYGSYIF